MTTQRLIQVLNAALLALDLGQIETARRLLKQTLIALQARKHK